MFSIGVNMPWKCILTNRRNKHAVFASSTRLLLENCLNEEVKFSKRFFSRTASDTGHSKLVLSPFPLRPHRCRRGFAAEDDKAYRSISDTNKSGPGFTYHWYTMEVPCSDLVTRLFVQFSKSYVLKRVWWVFSIITLFWKYTNTLCGFLQQWLSILLKMSRRRRPKPW